FTIKADDGVVKENVLVENLTVGEAEKKDEIYLKNNVQIIGYLNSNIKCDSLSWDSISETMHTQDKVEIEAEKWNINGEGIEFSPSGDIMTINKDVTMQIN
ncbi:MAG: LPS export ABC transporter periplasmic protein LptC, partial [Candidatus Omnitrophica bacterium]|nr:LPS export ABC transporter periplasmic protein LptC [Candidatus Omnitrophota bacterium]